MVITEQKQLDRILEIIDSCKTELQLESCRNFINPKFFEYKCPLDKDMIIFAIIKKELDLFVQFDYRYTLNLL